MGTTIRGGRAVVGMASLFLLGACDDKFVDFVNVVPPALVGTSLTVSTASQNQTGIAGAASILVGHAIGRGESGTARQAAKAALVCGVGFMVVSAIVFTSSAMIASPACT